jgi:hypothetical protein
MMEIEYGLGRFNDLRLEKGGCRCIKRWCSGRAAVSDDLAARVSGRCSSRVSCATRR